MSENNPVFGLGAFSQLWRLVRGRVPFYPLFQNFFMNRKLPIYIDISNLMLVYLSTPLVRTILDKKAEMMKNARFEVYKIGDDENPLEAHPILDLLNNPNPLQDIAGLIQQWSIYRDIYANTFMRKVKATSAAYPKVLWNLPPGEIKIIPTGKLFDQTTFEGVIEKYVLFNSGQFQPIDYLPADIIQTTCGTSDKYFFSESKLITNKLIISNYVGAYKTRNCIINDRGALGILSSTGKEGTGAIPFGSAERDRLNESYKEKYGIEDDQTRVIMSSSALKYQSMSFPTADLMLFEEEENCFSMMCAAYGMDRKLFPDNSAAKPQAIGSDGKGKTEEAMKTTYQNTIQQEIDIFCNQFNYDVDFGLIKSGYILRGSFKHLPVMQEDEVLREQVESEKTVSLSQMLKDGIISKQEYREAMGLEGMPPAESEAPQQPAKVLTPEEQAAQETATQTAIGKIASNGIIKKIFA